MKNVFELITYNKHKLAFYYLSILSPLNEERIQAGRTEEGGRGGGRHRCFLDKVCSIKTAPSLTPRRYFDVELPSGLKFSNEKAHSTFQRRHVELRCFTKLLLSWIILYTYFET